METALQVSFYVVGGVFVLGMLMVGVLIHDVFFHGRFRTALPPVKRVPTSALDAARDVYARLQAALRAAPEESRDTIAYELRHLEMRIEALEDKTYTDQSDYYAAVKARERIWRQWRSAHQELRRASFHDRRKLRGHADQLGLQYRKLSHEVEEEYARALARDTLTLEELNSSGVLEPEVLRLGAGPRPARITRTERSAPPEGAAQAGPVQAAQRGPRSGRWITRLPPYPPAQGGLLGQEDLSRPDVQKSERTYVDPTFSMAGLPDSVLANVDFGRSSLAEVEFSGPQRFLGCSFVATDLRRIEMRLANGPHMFQDCDLRGASLAQAQLSGVVFRRCNLAGTHWRSAHLDRVKFESCRLDNVRWEGADLSRTVMSEDMLAHADFSFAAKPPLNLRPAMESPPELTAQSAPVADNDAQPAAVPAAAPPEGETPEPGVPPAASGTQAQREE